MEEAMRRIACVGILVLGGCFGVHDGGQSGTEVPDHCEDAGRTAITDLATPAEGLDFTPQDVLDAHEGDWAGSFTPVYGDPTDAALSLDVDPTGFELVSQTVITRTVDTDDPAAMDPLPMECPSYYAAPLTGTLSTADGLLSEAFATELVARSADGAMFTATLDAAAGTTAPTVFDPAEWDHTALLIDGQRGSDGTITGNAMWQGWNDSDTASDPAPADTADSVTTGTVGVSGMTEGVGSYAVLRP
jgi:hypothetical protein